MSSERPNAAPPAAVLPQPSKVLNLLAAIEEGDEDTVKSLLSLDEGFGLVNARREALCKTWNRKPINTGPTPLMIAMRYGHDGIASALLEAKADPSLQDQFSKTAPMYALEHGHASLQSLQTIIDTIGVDMITHKDEWGHNLIMYAALAGAAARLGTPPISLTLTLGVAGSLPTSA